MEQSRKILLIDDETEFSSTLAERLKIRQYDVKTAGSGEAGIALIQNETFNIIILDLIMPGMNGIDTLKQIKQIKADVPVILLTGHGSTNEGVQGMRLGAVDFLMKPLDINDLLIKINNALTTAKGELDD